MREPERERVLAGAQARVSEHEPALAPFAFGRPCIDKNTGLPKRPQAVRACDGLISHGWPGKLNDHIGTGVMPNAAVYAVR